MDIEFRTTVLLVLLSVAIAGCEETASPNPQDDVGVDASTAFLPDSPADEALCEGEWCWIHPSPLPYHIEGLRRSGDQLHGVTYVARGDESRPVVVDEEGPSLINLPTDADAELAGLTATDEGWLVATTDGKLTAFGPDGTVQQTLQLPGEAYIDLRGTSIDAFVAIQESGTGTVKRGESMNEIDNLTSRDPYLKMWGDGSLWFELVHPDQRELAMKDGWRAFATLRRGDSTGISTLGPSPTSECAGDGIWGSSFDAGLRRWNASEKRWSAEPVVDRWVRSIGCAPNGDVIGVDGGGGFLRRSDGEWSRRNGLGRDLTSIATLNDTLYLSGEKGEVLTVNQGEVTRNSGGYELPSRDVSSESPNHFYDLWTNSDASQAALLSDGVVYRAEGDAWEAMQVEGETYFHLQNETSEVWGIEKPRFVLDRYAIYSRNEETWSPVPAVESDDETFFAKDIAGHSSDSVWAVGSNQVFWYNGSHWTELTEARGQVQQFIEQEDIDMTALLAEKNGRVLMAADSSIYEITDSAGDWRIQKVMSTPCEDIRDMYQTEDGTLYIAADDLCVARQRPDGWTTLEPTFAFNDVRAGNGKKGMDFMPAADADSPLLATQHGLLKVTESNELTRIVFERVQDAVAVPRAGVSFILHEHGVMAKYH